MNETTSQLIYRVRKDGAITVRTLAEAEALIEAAAAEGYHFGQRQTFAGFRVADLDD